MRVSVPKIVTCCALILATACHSSNEDRTRDPRLSRDNRAVGLESKVGRSLSESELCAQPTADANGKTTVASLRFQRNATFLRRTRAMTTKSQFALESETSGTWGLFGELLYLTENDTSVKHEIEIFKRAADDATCVRFSNLENRPEYCACEF